MRVANVKLRAHIYFVVSVNFGFVAARVSSGRSRCEKHDEHDDQCEPKRAVGREPRLQWTTMHARTKSYIRTYMGQNASLSLSLGSVSVSLRTTPA